MNTSIYKAQLESDLIAKVQPVVEQLGYRLRDIELEGRALVRVIIDSAPGAPEVGIEDCEKVHRTLSPLFDVWDPLPTAYTLELSSPGEKPNLRTSEHFREALGGRVFLETLEALPMPPPAKPRRRWEGELAEVGDADLKLVDSYGEHRLPFNKIKNAQWLREWTLRDGN